MHCRAFNSILAFYPSAPAAHPMAQPWQPKIPPDVAYCSLRRWLRSTILEEPHNFMHVRCYPKGKEGSMSQLQFPFVVAGLYTPQRMLLPGP